MILPKVTLDISRNNFVYSACSMWNKCIDEILCKPVLSSITNSNGKIIEIIIPGSQKNSDLTLTVARFKRQLKNKLFSNQKHGEATDWISKNYTI